MCGTLELHLVAFWIWLPIRRISRRGSRIAMRPAAGSLPIIQCALGDASCRQRTLRQTSHRVCKDGDIGTTAYFLCDKQIRSSLVTEFALILVYRILFSFFRFQRKSCAKCFCVRQGDRLRRQCTYRQPLTEQSELRLSKSHPITRQTSRQT
jgi:hypothetical protein